jgi:hypothetical protein
MSIPIAIKEIQFYVRNVRTRMPFRYGTATVRAAPMLHVSMEVELASGSMATGYAADVLPPKWFDKDPGKSYEENIQDLVWGAKTAASIYREVASTPGVVFDIWRSAYGETLRSADEHGLNHLTGGHGSSLMERALIDGLGNATGMSYHQMLQANLPGIDLGALHHQLKGVTPGQIIAPTPLADLQVRHCVGLADPIRTDDIDDAERLVDGLPQALEEYIETQGISYFKIKVCGDQDADLERLRSIARLFETRTSPFHVSLDGNEQYSDIDTLIGMLEQMVADPVLRPLYDSIIFIEQPLDRSKALDPTLTSSIGNIPKQKPMIIDESDGDLGTFLEAVEVGYQGVSTKNCKGLIKAIANQALARHFGETYFLTGEDLLNLPVVPLHQDLVHLAALGIRHAERNGHHYVHGLDHLSDSERQVCRERHGNIYHSSGQGMTLNVVDGRIDLRSLQESGLGVSKAVDLRSMAPLDEWRFDSLD